MLPAYRRILLLTEGRLGPFTSKSAAALLRYRAEDVVGVIDSAFAGRDIRGIIPWARDVPILASMDQAAALRPEALFVGVAPVGGALPPPMRRHVLDALDARIDVVSGLHTRLNDDREFASRAAATGARLVDLRVPPAERTVASARARETRCRRILTVGSDCNVGKMVTALELTEAARRRGLRAAFVATGQTGIMISGRGAAIDACVSDFAAGAVEALVLAEAQADVCVIEGQGSLAHPGYSGVTLALLHGACPDAMVLCHHAGRTRYNAEPHHPLPDLARLRDLYESAAGVLHPARVVAVALNCQGASAEDVRRERTTLPARLGLPLADPVHDGCDVLLDAALRG